MVSKKNKKQSKKLTPKKAVNSQTKAKVKPNDNYLPRMGTLPDKIFARLAGRPMLFGELSVHVGKEIGLIGDALTSQLSAALYDLCHRGVVIRLDHRTQKPVPPKNARGALYALTDKVRENYLGRGGKAVSGEFFAGASNGAVTLTGNVNGPGNVNGSSNGTTVHGSEPRQLDLSGHGKPTRMSPAMFAELSAAKRDAEKQLAAIDSMLRDPAWS